MRLIDYLSYEGLNVHTTLYKKNKKFDLKKMYLDNIKRFPC